MLGFSPSQRTGKKKSDGTLMFLHHMLLVTGIHSSLQQLEKKKQKTEAFGSKLAVVDEVTDKPSAPIKAVCFT